MKRSLLILMVAFLTTSVFAQSENWNWQQRIVDTDGNIVKNEILEVTATVHDLSQEYYREIQVDSINANGILFITLERGSVPWGEKAFYLDLEFDSKKYEIKNIKNLPIDNVPEAFYAKTAGVATFASPLGEEFYELDSLGNEVPTNQFFNIVPIPGDFIFDTIMCQYDASIFFSPDRNSNTYSIQGCDRNYIPVVFTNPVVSKIKNKTITYSYEFTATYSTPIVQPSRDYDAATGGGFKEGWMYINLERTSVTKTFICKVTYIR